MSKYRPLKYREVVTILTKLGFSSKRSSSSSHQTWVRHKDGKFFAVTLAFHGNNVEFSDGTLNSIIRQSGLSKEEFYKVLLEK